MKWLPFVMDLATVFLGAFLGFIFAIVLNKLHTHLHMKRKLRAYVFSICNELKELRKDLTSLLHKFDGDFLLDTPIGNALKNSEYVHEFVIHKAGYSVCLKIYSNIAAIKSLRIKYEAKPNDVSRQHIDNVTRDTLKVIDLYLERHG